MKILVACEESQTVCIEARNQGHEAYSCDILPSSGGHPEWHIQDDVRNILYTQWDAIIAFPPCTYLTVSNNGAMAKGCVKYNVEEGKRLRKDAIEFFMMFVNYPCELKAIENPIGIMSTLYRKPDQIIQPYQFGENASKKTCLWLFGLPKLQPTNYYPPTITTSGKKIWANQTTSGQNKFGPSNTRAIQRSKTFPGISQAMCNQWLKEEKEEIDE